MGDAVKLRKSGASGVMGEREALTASARARPVAVARIRKNGRRARQLREPGGQ